MTIKRTGEKNKVLYLSYDGLSDHIGQSQILPYLLACKEKGIDIDILTFEKRSKQERVQQIQKMLDEHQVRWYRIVFSEGGHILKAYDFFKFIFCAFRLTIKNKYSIVHSRSYFASSIGLMVKYVLRRKLIFDKRDFWIDAKVETGRIDLSKPLHRIIHSFLRFFEKRLFLHADHIISLTERAKAIVLQKYPSRRPKDITVIPCCVDLSLFNPDKVSADRIMDMKNKLGLNGHFVLGYVGSIDPAYKIPDLLDCFKVIKSKMATARLLFLVNNDKEQVYAIADERNIPREDIIVTSAPRNLMPLYISLLDIGFYFIMPTYAKQATSPTKLSEMLAMKIPVITNKGVGDVERIVSDLHCGYLVSDFKQSEYEQASEWLLTRDGRKQLFDLQKYSLQSGAMRYFNVYKNLFEK